MRYSIITPTLARESLLKTCESIDNQNNSDWQHIVMVDVALIAFPEKKKVIDAVRKDPRRKIVRCGKQHKDFGNTCRYNAYEYCSGDYVLFLDDDDVYADNKVLETLNQVTKPWATFPTLKQGVYYSSEPGLNRMGSGMFMHRREIGRYPCASHLEGYEEIIARLKPSYQNMTMHQFLYASDGLLTEYLKERYPFEALNCRALTIYESAQKGA
jgi:glycosyltransferase involved in cell wall biosynthesis